jgi:hypothetical protein
MHPVVGPRLLSGEFYNEDALPKMLRGLMKAAGRQFEGIDFEWVLPTAEAGARGGGKGRGAQSAGRRGPEQRGGGG